MVGGGQVRQLACGGLHIGASGTGLLQSPVLRCLGKSRRIGQAFRGCSTLCTQGWWCTPSTQHSPSTLSTA